MKTNKLLNILIPILIAILVLVAAFEGYKAILRNETAREAEAEMAKKRIPSDENSINFVTEVELEAVNEDGASVFLTYEDFLKSAERTSYYVGETSTTYRLARELTSGGNNVYVLHFKMRSDYRAAKINVDFGAEHTYYVTTEWHDYYVPCMKGKIDIVKIMLLTDFQKLYLSDLQILQYDSMSIKPAKIKNGAYLAEECERYYPAEDAGIGVGKMMDIIGKDGYIYSAGEDILTISKINENGAESVASLKGVGNVKHIKIRDDKTLGLASRENGVCFVNIEDKTKPYIEGFYDTLEIAEDVCFSDNYMFVANRYFGVEIVDISNINKPAYIGRIANGKEACRCTVDENYLFVSCRSTNEVEIYDISVLDKHKFITSIPVDGRCGEALVKDNLLYIVSGYWGNVTLQDIGDPDYANGNGMVIYDISDIKHPKWLSTAKTDGSMGNVSYDDWSIRVNNGYAYFTNSFGGLYVYNVSEPSNPIAVAHMGTPIYNGSENYVDFSKNPRVVFPYDISEFIYSPVMGVYVCDGAVYYAGAYNDVYRVDFANAADDTKYAGYDFTFADNVKKSNDYELYHTDCDINALIKCDYGYIAAANTGLLLLDENLSKVAEYATDNPVKDVKLTSDGYIVTAEKVGVGVYLAYEYGFSPMSFIKSTAHLKNVSSVEVTGDGNYAIAQSSSIKMELIDLRDKSMPSFVSEVVNEAGEVIGADAITRTGTMYYRNIVSGTVNGVVGIGGGTNMMWFESKNGSLHVRNSYTNILNSETNGSAVMGNGKDILSVYSNGYVVYNPLTATETALRGLTKYHIANVKLNGKASIRDNILVLCNAPNGTIQIVNIDKPSAPYLITSYSVEESPGIALIEDGYVLVPIRHGGIIRIDIE